MSFFKGRFPLIPVLWGDPHTPNRGVTPPPAPRGIRGGGFRSPPPPTPPLPQTTKGFAPGPQTGVNKKIILIRKSAVSQIKEIKRTKRDLGSRGRALGRLGKGRCRRGRGSKPSPSDPPGFGGWGHPPVGVWGLCPQKTRFKGNLPLNINKQMLLSLCHLW